LTLPTVTLEPHTALEFMLLQQALEAIRGILPAPDCEPVDRLLADA